jgi:hypothetical protein
MFRVIARNDTYRTLRSCYRDTFADANRYAMDVATTGDGTTVRAIIMDAQDRILAGYVTGESGRPRVVTAA